MTTLTTVWQEGLLQPRLFVSRGPVSQSQQYQSVSSFASNCSRRSSADLTSVGSPKRSAKNFQRPPSNVSLEYTRTRNAQNSNHVDPLDRENEVRLFGFRRIGTVFPAGSVKNSGKSGPYHFPEHKFMTMPHKKQQVKDPMSIFFLVPDLLA